LRWIPVALAFTGCATIFLGGLARFSGQFSSGHSDTTSSSVFEITGPQARAGRLSPLFTPQVLSWSSQITLWAESWQLDPNLVATVLQIESCGHPGIHSNAGAIGLFQVMPYHFESHEDPEDPQVNAQRGLSYLAQALILADGDVGRALAGYNAGHGVIERPIHEWPEETKRYVRWGTGIFHDASSDFSSSPTLESWLSAGGAHLCQQSLAALTGDQ
jgi:hypothetical protein